MVEKGLSFNQKKETNGLHPKRKSIATKEEWGGKAVGIPSKDESDKFRGGKCRFRCLTWYVKCLLNTEPKGSSLASCPANKPLCFATLIAIALQFDAIEISSIKCCRIGYLLFCFSIKLFVTVLLSFCNSSNFLFQYNSIGFGR